MTKPHAPAHSGTVLLSMALLLIGSLVTMAGCVEEQTLPAEEGQQASTDPIASGKATYDQYCMGCHGADGKGTGEIGAELTTMPADLTQLAARHNGNFPVDSVYQFIDGRKAVEAHGPREMPVWGNIWDEEEGEPVQEDVVEHRINELIEYIRSIQE